MSQVRLSKTPFVYHLKNSFSYMYVFMYLFIYLLHNYCTYWIQMRYILESILDCFLYRREGHRTGLGITKDRVTNRYRITVFMQEIRLSPSDSHTGTSLHSPCSLLQRTIFIYLLHNYCTYWIQMRYILESILDCFLYRREGHRTGLGITKDRVTNRYRITVFMQEIRLSPSDSHTGTSLHSPCSLLQRTIFLYYTVLQ